MPMVQLSLTRVARVALTKLDLARALTKLGLARALTKLGLPRMPMRLALALPRMLMKLALPRMVTKLALATCWLRPALAEELSKRRPRGWRFEDMEDDGDENAKDVPERRWAFQYW
jgi:hypothetical protein